MLSTDTKTVWRVDYPSKLVPALQGKKKDHVIDLIGGIAILPRPTTREIARFVLSRSKSYEYKPVREKDARIREQIYYKLLVGRKKTHGKKKSSISPGLVSTGYVVKGGPLTNEKKKEVSRYLLTLKGCFLALGYHFDYNELISFIVIAAVNHVSFAYLKVILEKTSIQFVKKTFIEPIQDLIKKEKISLDDEIGFYFSFIADNIENSLNKIIQEELIQCHESSDKFRSEYLDKVEILIKNTWHVTNKQDKWVSDMMDLYYPDDRKQEFYVSFSEKDLDFKLLYRLMKAVHYAYYGTSMFYGSHRINLHIPQKHAQKLKLPHKKYHSSKKSLSPPGKIFFTGRELYEYGNKINNRDSKL